MNTTSQDPDLRIAMRLVAVQEEDRIAQQEDIWALEEDLALQEEYQVRWEGLWVLDGLVLYEDPTNAPEALADIMIDPWGAHLLMLKYVADKEIKVIIVSMFYST